MSSRTGRYVAGSVVLGLLALVPMLPLVGCSEAKAEPLDVTYEEAIHRFASQQPESPGKHRRRYLFLQERFFFHEAYIGRNALFADGSVSTLPPGIDRETLSSLLTIDDGKGWPESEDDHRSRSGRKLNVGNCVRFAIFVLLVLYPLPWVWLNPHPRGKVTQAQTHAGRSPPSRLDW